MATVPEARAWQQEPREATETFQTATDGRRALPPPIDIRSFRTAPRPVDTHGYQPAVRLNTVAAVIDEFLEAARAGQTADLNGRPYEADQLPDMRWSLRGYVASDLGELGFAELNAAELREFIDRLDADGVSQARTGAVMKALRALLRFAADRGMAEWSAGDLLVFGDTDDELPDPPPPSPAATTMAKGVLPQVNSAVAGSAPASAPAPARDTAVAPAAASGAVPDKAIRILKLVTLVFLVIALVLVAESA
jgi:hypothetical protein